MPERICEYCGRTFTARADARYCSPAHRAAAFRTDIRTEEPVIRTDMPAGEVPAALRPARTDNERTDKPGGDQPATGPRTDIPEAHAGHRIHPHTHVTLPAHGTEPARRSPCSGRWYCRTCGDAWHHGTTCGERSCKDTRHHQHPERGWFSGAKCA